MKKGFLVILLSLLCAVLSVQQVFAQTNVTGRVTDSVSGKPLVGATIQVQGENITTTTNENGVYTVSVQSTGALLLFSYIGYLNREEALMGRNKIDVSLQLLDAALEEVVVVGYGQQKKGDVTGAISSVSGNEIVQSTVPNLTNSLIGRVPGIIAVQRNGEPGDDAADLLVRGRATLNNNSPLILVDGIPRDFAQIDPNEIESLSVLKDAAATAVYGIRGANGVILVTTKKGKTGKPSFSYTGYVGVQNPTQIPKYLNSYDFARLYNEAALNDNPDADLPYSEEDLQKYRDHSSPFTHPDVNWYESVLQSDAVQQRHSLSTSGGSENINYFLLFGYFDQQGMYRSINFSKYNLRANIDADLTKSTKLTVGLAGGLERKKHPGVLGSREDGGIFSTTTYLPPNAFPIKNEDGSWASLWGTNPVADIVDGGYRKNDGNNIQTSFTLDQKLDFLTKGLAVKVVYAYDYGTYNAKDWFTPYRSFLASADGYEEIGAGRKPSLYEEFYQYNNKTFETHINYNRTFDKHELGLLVLYTQTANYTNYINASRTDFASSALDQLFAGPRTNIDNNGGASESGREGVVGRISYNYDQKYLLEASFGYNGSENFASSRRYGFFPAVSAGWNMAKEPFFQDIAWMNQLKVRASYGEVGNDQVSDRRFLYRQPVYYGDTYVFGGSSPQPVQTLYIGELANPNVTWERAKKSNIGFDLEIKDGLLGLTGNVFFEDRNNILAMRNQSVPGTFGAELPVENIAKVSNKGIEVEWRHRHTLGALEYFVNANYTFARNRIKFIDEAANIPLYRQRTGKPIGQFFGYISEGLYQTQEQIDNDAKIQGVEPRLGDIKYKDLNGDGIINSNDISAIGKSETPESVFGINFGGKFKGFDLNVLLQGAGGYNVTWQGEATLEFAYGSSAMEHHLDRWTPDNPNASYPRLSLDQYSYKQEESSFWLQNAGYLRVKNIELGYTFPQSLVPGNIIKRLRIHCSGTNLFTWSKVNMFDPEAPSGSPYFYPLQKAVTVGLNLDF